MSPTLLIADRGEIALRIGRTATELGIPTAAGYAEDDADSPHVHAADEALGLLAAGPCAYLDQSTLLGAAKRSGATLIHSGYGFRSENAQFARSGAAAGYTFVGPDADVLELVGNTSSGRRPPRPPTYRCCPQSKGRAAPRRSRRSSPPTMAPS